MRIAMITVSPTAARAVERAWASEAFRPLGERASLAIKSLRGEGSVPLPEAEAFLDTDFLLLDLMGADRELQDALPGLLARKRPGQVAVVNTDAPTLRTLTRLGSFSMQGMAKKNKKRLSADEEGRIDEPDPERMLRMARMMEKAGSALPVGPLLDARNAIWLGRYWRYPSNNNIDSLLSMIGGRYLGVAGLPEPAPPEEIACPVLVDLPDGRRFDSMDELDEAVAAAGRLAPPEAGRVGLLFPAGTYPLDSHGITATLIGSLRERFRVYPVAAATGAAETLPFLRGLFMDASTGSSRVDCLVSLNAFRLGQGPMGGDASEAERFLAELGVPFLHPFVMSKRSRAEWEADARGLGSGEFMLHYFLPELDGASSMLPIAAASRDGLEPLPEGARSLAERIGGLVALRRRPPRERSVAIVLYDYPPGEASAGAAAFLDSFGSVSALLAALVGAGYDTEALPADELRARLVAGGFCNDGGYCMAQLPSLNLDDYDALAGDDPFERARLRRLGERIDEAWGSFPGPVLSAGGLVRLPLLRIGKVTLAFQPPRVDAEAIGSGAYHDPYLPPHHQYLAFYRYLERGLGVDAVVHIGTHGTLEFLPGKELAPSGDCFPSALIGGLPHFYYYYSGNPSEAMIAKRKAHAMTVGYLQPPYGEAGLSGPAAELALLRDEYAQATLADPDRAAEVLADIQGRMEGLGWPWAGIESLDEELDGIRRGLIPLGHHRLGQPYGPGEAADFLAVFLKEDREGYPSAWREAATARVFDYDAMVAQPARHSSEWALLAADVRGTIEEGLGGEDPAWAPCRALRDALTTDAEIPALLRCLDGGYAAPGLAGDPYRSPDVLPTGRNLCQFDPRRAPTPSALRRGRAVAEATLAEYLARNGRYPEQVAVVLWGLEASRTEGETVAQALAYLGVRLRPGRSLWDARVELVPRSELGRPRVDVSVQISGFFRDLFPNLMSLLDEAVSLAAAAGDEPDNTVSAHVEALRRSLEARGASPADALERASARIFGPPPGVYGTGLTTTVRAGAWKDETELSDGYRASMRYAYTRRRYGEADGEALDANLSRVELVSQIRSGREYEITDLDHYYEHFGGLARSVRELSGRNAAMLVSDSLEGRARTEDVGASVRRGVRARLLNPRWLDAVLATEHRGGQEVADRLENLVGLAAGTGAVPSAVFDEAARRLVLDEAMRGRLERNNPYAVAASAERLLEAAGRGYWDADEEALDRLRDLCLDLEGDLEARSP